jgi:hypothetical protein
MFISIFARIFFILVAVPIGTKSAFSKKQNSKKSIGKWLEKGAKEGWLREARSEKGGWKGREGDGQWQSPLPDYFLRQASF